MLGLDVMCDSNPKTDVLGRRVGCDTILVPFSKRCQKEKVLFALILHNKNDDRNSGRLEDPLAETGKYTNPVCITSIRSGSEL